MEGIKNVGLYIDNTYICDVFDFKIYEEVDYIELEKRKFATIKMIGTECINNIELSNNLHLVFKFINGDKYELYVNSVKRYVTLNGDTRLTLGIYGEEYIEERKVVSEIAGKIFKKCKFKHSKSSGVLLLGYSASNNKSGFSIGVLKKMKAHFKKHLTTVFKNDNI